MKTDFVITPVTEAGGRTCFDIALHPVRAGKVAGTALDLGQWRLVNPQAGAMLDWYLKDEVGRRVGAQPHGPRLRVSLESLEQTEDWIQDLARLPLPTSDHVELRLRTDGDPELRWKLSRSLDPRSQDPSADGTYMARGRLRYLPMDMVRALDAFTARGADGAVPPLDAIAGRAAALMPEPAWELLRRRRLLVVELASRLRLLPVHDRDRGWRYVAGPVRPERPDILLVNSEIDLFSEAVDAIGGAELPQTLLVGETLFYLDEPVRALLGLVRAFNALPATVRAERIVGEKEHRKPGTLQSLTRIEVYGRHVYAYGPWDAEDSRAIALYFRRHDGRATGRRLLVLDPFPGELPPPDEREAAAAAFVATVQPGAAMAGGDADGDGSGLPLDLSGSAGGPTDPEGAAAAPADGMGGGPAVDPAAADVPAELGRGPGRPSDLLTRLNIHSLLRPDELRPRTMNAGWGRAEILGEVPRKVLADEPPMEHQLSAYETLLRCYRAGAAGALLCHEPGLGKTWTALAVANAVQSSTSEPVLVVTEPGLVEQWRDELLGRFTSHPRRYLYEAHDPAFRRKAPMFVANEMARHPFVITTWPTFVALKELFGLVRFSLAILDEVSLCRNIDTGFRHAADIANADFKLGLTGTPGENNLVDIWSQADLVRPGCLGTLVEFVERYVRAEAGPNGEAALASLRERLTGGSEPVLLHQTLAGAGIDLPEQRVHKPRLAMPEEQARTYDRIARNGNHRWRKLSPPLRQASIHPDFQSLPAAPTRAQARAWIARGAPIAYALDLVERCRERGGKLLIFTSDVEYVQAYVARALAAAIGLPRPIPCVNGLRDRTYRYDAIRAFKEAPAFAVLMITCRTGGRGLNLVEANDLLHLDRWFNPATEQQSTRRAYRMGLTHPVDIHIPSAVHPAYGENSYSLILDRHIERKKPLGIDFLARTSVDTRVVEVELEEALLHPAPALPLAS